MLGKWKPWVATKDSVCPVHQKSVVKVLLDTGYTFGGLGSDFSWENEVWGDIVAYQVTEAYKEPLEFWANIYDNNCGVAWETEKEAEKFRSNDCIRTIKVREVIE